MSGKQRHVRLSESLKCCKNVPIGSSLTALSGISRRQMVSCGHLMELLKRRRNFCRTPARRAEVQPWQMS